MTATSSNLSDAHYGYDLVCAVTQDSINATMREHLSAVQPKDFSACYVVDPTTKATVLTPLADIVAQLGGDPFSIPNNADSSNPMVQKLDKANFAFGFKAKMGQPTGVAPADMPDIIRLDKRGLSVSYRLYCAEFSVIVLNRNSGGPSFVNLQQPSASPWLFELEVGLGLRAGDQNSFSKLPPQVQQRVRTLAPNAPFRIEQLNLNFSLASLEQRPTIQGLDPASDTYATLTRSFITQYWSNLGPAGVLLGYVVIPAMPGNNLIVPTNLAVEVSPHVDGQGKPTTNYGLYTLDYLVMSNNRPMPPPVPFNWNWIDAAQVAAYHGATSIRRDVLLDNLLMLLNRNAAGLCIDPNVELHHSGETYTIRYTWAGARQPTSFAKVAPVSVGGGYTKVATFAYSHDSYDDSTGSFHLSSINGTFNYAINGDVAIGDGNKIRVTLHAVVFVEFNSRQAGVRHTVVSGNQMDFTHVTTYAVAAAPDGRLVVTETTADTGGFQDLPYSNDARVPNIGIIRDVVMNCANNANERVRSAAGNLANTLASMIDSSQAWVYPCGKTPTAKATGFSSGLDLVTYVTYG